MRKHSRQFIVAGIAGLIVSIVVAWISAGTDYSSDRAWASWRPPIDVRSTDPWRADRPIAWPRPAPAGWQRPTDIHVESDAFMTIAWYVRWPPHTNWDEGRAMTAWRVGVPFRCLQWVGASSYRNSRYAERFVPVDASWANGFAVADSPWRRLPVDPLWLGLALNVLFYTILILALVYLRTWLIWIGGMILFPLTIRMHVQRYRRLLRRGCPMCGYNLLRLEQCPECGWVPQGPTQSE